MTIQERQMTLSELRRACDVSSDFAAMAHFYALRMETRSWFEVVENFARESTAQAIAFGAAVDKAEMMGRIVGEDG